MVVSFGMTRNDESTGPGKARTWWHPLLVRLLEHSLSPGFEVRDEVSVGTLPLRADIVLIRREQSDLLEAARSQIPALLRRLNRWTLIEFKSPVDSLQRGDLDRLLGVAHLFCGQQPDPPDSEEMSLVILAPSVTDAFEADVRIRGMTQFREEEGVLRIDGGLFPLWLLESDHLWGPEEPVMAVVSRVFLQQGKSIMDVVRGLGSDPILLYAIQQIEQFKRLGGDFMVQHTHTPEMDQEYAALKEAFVRSLSLEERLADLSLEERLAGLSAEQRRQLLEFLQREASGRNGE
jgi:hypothetical protein